MLQKIKNTSSLFVSYDHASDIPENDWKTINKGCNLFLSIRYLKILEDSLSETIRFKYILFYDNNIPVALAVTQLIRFTTNELKFQEFPCVIHDAIKKVVLKNLDVKVLVCGNLFSCGEHGFMYTEQIPTEKAYEILYDALQTIHKSDTQDKPSFILVKEFWPTSYNKSDAIKKQGFKEFKIDTNMVLELHPKWNTFEDYLMSMKTKFRTRTKKVFKKSSDIAVKNFNAQDIDTHKNSIDTLYFSVLEKADFKIGKLNATTFRNLKNNLGSDFIFKAYFLNTTLVGFTTAFIVKDTLEANHIGIDYTFNKTHAIYQKMLYDYVAMAITYKVTELRLGRTAETIKSGIGAKPIDMKLYVRHRNLISNKILTPLVDLVSPNEYEIRNPFKLELD